MLNLVWPIHVALCLIRMIEIIIVIEVLACVFSSGSLGVVLGLKTCKLTHSIILSKSKVIQPIFIILKNKLIIVLSSKEIRLMYPFYPIFYTSLAKLFL